ncbi:hypothetical protein D3C87_2129200 [compost metagenome]
MNVMVFNGQLFQNAFHFSQVIFSFCHGSTYIGQNNYGLVAVHLDHLLQVVIIHFAILLGTDHNTSQVK